MIRPATTDDTAVLQAMIKELAADEKSAVATTEDELRDALSGDGGEPLAFAHVAVDEKTGEVIGYTLWSLVYSTWRGAAVHIDDIYIRPRAAGQGYDTALLTELARISAERGYRYMEWWAMESKVKNTIYYESLGASCDPDLTVFRLSGDALTRLGTGSSAAG